MGNSWCFCIYSITCGKRSCAYSITCRRHSCAYVIILQTRSRSILGVAELNSLLCNSLSADASQGLPSDAYASRANLFIEVPIFNIYMGKMRKSKIPCRTGRKLTCGNRKSAKSHVETDENLHGKIEITQNPMYKQIGIYMGK